MGTARLCPKGLSSYITPQAEKCAWQGRDHATAQQRELGGRFSGPSTTATGWEHCCRGSFVTTDTCRHWAKELQVWIRAIYWIKQLALQITALEQLHPTARNSHTTPKQHGRADLGRNGSTSGCLEPLGHAAGCSRLSTRQEQQVLTQLSSTGVQELGQGLLF